MESIIEIVKLQQQAVDRWHQGELDNPCPPNSILAAVCQQHQFNFQLWHEEDIARSREVTDQEIARVKRAIDSYNQQRNDWIERIDDLIASELEDLSIAPKPDARLNTETPGAAIDRLSILSLRIYHLREQLDRTDVDESHHANVTRKLSVCEAQQRELANSLQELIDDLRCGKKRHRTYRQLKMYNDPTLNPYLYRTRCNEGTEVEI